LKNKIGISVSTSRSTATHDPVKEMIERFMKANQMNILGHVTVDGYDQCYTCGFGHDCKVGNVVRKHGVLAKIEKEHLPLEFNEQSRTLQQVHEAVQLVKNASRT
jgi:hypothetical protein